MMSYNLTPQDVVTLCEIAEHRAAQRFRQLSDLTEDARVDWTAAQVELFKAQEAKDKDEGRKTE